MNIQKALNEIGLNEKEAEVYLALLRHASLKPSVIARRTTLSRPTVYDILQSLQKKGLVYTTKNKTTQTFTARDPRFISQNIDREVADFTAEAEKKKQRLTETMPELLNLAKNALQLPRVTYFEGEKGIEEALYATLATKDIIRAYANIESITSSMGERFSRYLVQRVKRGIQARAIAPDTKEWRQRIKESKKELRDVRFMKEGSFFSPEINIYGDHVLMISWKEHFAVLITSKDFAQTQKIIYDELWNRL